MHYHHRHDVDGCVDAHDTWPEPYRVILATLDRLESRMSTQQDTIDTAVTVLGDLVSEVENLKASLAAAPLDTVDTAKLDAAVAAAQAVLAPAPAPAVDPAPAPVVDPAPVAPAADTPAPAVDAPAAPVAATGLGDSTVIA